MNGWQYFALHLAQSPITGFNPGKSRFATPHDSTVGVGAGFYWFAAGFLLFLVIGTAKAFWDDRKWTGDVKKIKGRQRGRPSRKDDSLVIRP